MNNSEYFDNLNEMDKFVDNSRNFDGRWRLPHTNKLFNLNWIQLNSEIIYLEITSDSTGKVFSLKDCSPTSDSINLSEWLTELRESF